MDSLAHNNGLPILANMHATSKGSSQTVQHGTNHTVKKKQQSSVNHRKHRDLAYLSDTDDLSNVDTFRMTVRSMKRKVTSKHQPEPKTSVNKPRVAHSLNSATSLTHTTSSASRSGSSFPLTFPAEKDICSQSTVSTASADNQGPPSAQPKFPKQAEQHQNACKSMHLFKSAHHEPPYSPTHAHTSTGPVPALSLVPQPLGTENQALSLPKRRTLSRTQTLPLVKHQQQCLARHHRTVVNESGSVPTPAHPTHTTAFACASPPTSRTTVPATPTTTVEMQSSCKLSNTTGVIMFASKETDYTRLEGFLEDSLTEETKQYLRSLSVPVAVYRGVVEPELPPHVVCVHLGGDVLFASLFEQQVMTQVALRKDVVIKVEKN